MAVVVLIRDAFANHTKSIKVNSVGFMGLLLQEYCHVAHRSDLVCVCVPEPQKSKLTA